MYLAEREQPMCWPVVLKVINLGVDSKVVNAGFKAGRKAVAFLGRMSNAKVLYAGATDTGWPGRTNQS